MILLILIALSLSGIILIQNPKGSSKALVSVVGAKTGNSFVQKIYLDTGGQYIFNHVGISLVKKTNY